MKKERKEGVVDRGRPGKSAKTENKLWGSRKNCDKECVMIARNRD
jgi:hypothetical protein